MKQPTYTKQQILELLHDADVDVLNAVGRVLQDDRKLYPLNDWFEITIVFIEAKLDLLAGLFIEMAGFNDSLSAQKDFEKRTKSLIEEMVNLAFELALVKKKSTR